MISKASFDFSDILILWYRKNHRDLPWRRTSDPYIIWLSEIILQQTRVDQGLPYFNRFLERFPTLRSFSQGTEDEILKLWQGLGYYSRARNMRATAVEVVKQHKGTFPADLIELKSLKGIGPYTAAAIASFAFDLPHAVVDGNVMRVISRVFGLTEDPSSQAGKIIFAQKANNLLNPKKAALHNQAIMEFGALQCKPANPDCESCPLAEHCVAFATGRVGELPTKSAKQQPRTRYFNYLLVRSAKGLWIRKRPSGDIWAGLYELPMIETHADRTPDRLIKSKEWKSWFGNYKTNVLCTSEIVRHRLSHQLIVARLMEVKIGDRRQDSIFKNCIRVEERNLDKYPIPRLLEKLWNEWIG